MLRLFNFGATSLPGALALKICPDILGYAAKNVDIIAVTGTNGKTTSARIIERALQNAGKSVCANRSGANLMPGITAELIMNKSLFGSTRCESAVIECDEAACRLVLGRLRPRVLLITNLFRDQLDRYGTVTYPRDCIAAGLRDTPETTAVINADCPMAASVSRLCQNKTVYYGRYLPRLRKKALLQGTQLRKSRRVFLLLRLCEKRAGCERGVGIPGRELRSARRRR